MQNTQGIELHCYHEDCQYTWKYNGGSTIYATCPQCLRKVKINRAYNGS